MNKVISDRELKLAAEAEHQPNLLYINGIDSGITRQLTKSGFIYFAPDGKRIVDGAEVQRLNALAIPPAYRDVIISANPLTHLQAIGTDAQGRRQYRYHPAWQSERDKAKFDRLLDFASSLPDIRRQVDADLRSRGMHMNKALATVVWMLDNLYIRVGNASYARTNRSYGLTTLKNRHVHVEGGNIKFRFKGKSGREWNLVHTDRRIANVVRQLQELPGQQLFQYASDEGGYRQISSSDVNAYIRNASGGDYSSKQFRTWGATCMAAAILAPLEVETSNAAIAQQVNDAIDEVSGKLANTRSVCRSSYIHPAVIEEFRAGRLKQVCKLKTRSARLLKWMEREEISVLLWLKALP